MPVITFSLKYPTTHPMKGAKTFFVEKIWAGLLPIYGEEVMNTYLKPHDGILWDIKRVKMYSDNPKIHTIRKGFNRSKGGIFSPRVWSGKPYTSPQIQFAPDLSITAAHLFNIDEKKNILIDGAPEKIDVVAANDGLSTDNFMSWFEKPMSGQVICWNELFRY